MIDGLKLTVTGDELRTLLDQRIEDHLRRAERWKREQARTAYQQTEDEPLLPDHICENEAERHEWRADVLGFYSRSHRLGRGVPIGCGQSGFQRIAARQARVAGTG